MIEYPILKHRYGIRRYDMLKAPRFSSAANVQLPFGGVLHYYSDVLEDLGPSLENQFLKGITRPIFIDYVTELKSFVGQPRTLTVPVEPLRRQHARNNRMMRPIRNREAAFRDPKGILVENYCLMERRYRYLPGLRGAYNRWYNTWYTMVEKMAEVASEAPLRQQFVQINVPRQLMSLSELRRAENGGQKMPLDALRKLTGPDQMTLVDLFTWLGNFREGSVLSLLNDEALKTINLCWIDTGCWTFVNLGDLDRWREIPKGEIDVRVEQSPEEEREAIRKALTSRRGSPIKPRTLQKDFVNLLLQVAGLRVVSVDDRVVDAVVDEPAPTEHPMPSPEKTSASTNAKPKPETVEVNTSVRKDQAPSDEGADSGGAFDKEQIIQSIDDDDALLDLDQADQLIDESDQRIEEFDRLTEELNARLAKKIEEQEALAESEPESLGDYVIDQADLYAEKGVITPDAYRRSVKLADRYKEIPNPVPGQSGTLEDLIQPALEAIELPELNPVAPKKLDGVTDESMLYNTKDEMDRQYLKTFHHKNIARMAMSVQKAGVAVQNYSIQHVDNHMDSYEVHTVKLVPVGGAPSTITFKIPKVKEDGSYLAGGVRYRLRSQRTD